ncbi:hypothetical protein BRE01_65630 [Brevibacillus reuszeri]|nr:copper amine oxidase N-terminal domain-containing protein [Brevibacillus reuszeri]MED1861074.1 copper amine oxidase N-terminal domain-containing protein [Brevibacillus reuszeri]GED72861.1 hypothetical protein BRE01_65630 [Brevibacillus reuszeri]
MSFHVTYFGKSKRVLMTLLLLLIIMSAFGYHGVTLAQENTTTVTILIDDKEVPSEGQTSILIGGTVFFPAKSLFQALSIHLKWDQTTNTVKGYRTNELWIEIDPSKEIGTLEGKPFLIEPSPMVINGTLMLPSTIIPQLFNYETNYEPFTRTLKIDTTSYVGINPYTSYQKKMQRDLDKSSPDKLFEDILSLYLEKTIYYRGGGVYDSNGNKIYLDNLTPMSIVKVDKSQPDIRTLTLLSGSKTYTLDLYNEFDILDTFLYYDPYKKYNWSKNTWDQIKLRNVHVGMNVDMVLLAKGNPLQRIPILNDQSQSEQWVYQNGTNGYLYLTFTEGVLASIQNHK